MLQRVCVGNAIALSNILLPAIGPLALLSTLASSSLHSTQQLIKSLTFSPLPSSDTKPTHFYVITALYIDFHRKLSFSTSSMNTLFSYFEHSPRSSRVVGATFFCTVQYLDDTMQTDTYMTQLKQYHIQQLANSV